MKTIKSIKADYAAAIRALRAERDEAVKEARAARAEKRDQALSMPLLNGSEAVSETFEQRAERVMKEVKQLTIDKLAIENAQEKAIIVNAFSVAHPDFDVASLINEAQVSGQSYDHAIYYMMEEQNIEPTEAEQDALFVLETMDIYISEEQEKLHNRIHNLSVEYVMDEIEYPAPSERLAAYHARSQAEFWAKQEALKKGE